jgi:hypothetical protein
MGGVIEGLKRQLKELILQYDDRDALRIMDGR